MYLKSIEVQGFKSFANKINFEFHNGITAIVGPNGSGKSNVADAVRWVLGEQRIKQLRGGKMEDVIFSGTETRKPQGFAYVAITLCNSDKSLPVDYDDVTVSRRLFRSGESEYMINDHVCRLKDINELFYDTGIGKEGYSIIGQGQIDKILSGKPEERRELFDEAAGIVKFKKRKAEAFKKLENEKANLVRVVDILSELEKQIKPLKNQSENARIYLSLKDELKKADTKMFVKEVSKIKADLSENERVYNISSESLLEYNKKLEEIKAGYEELEKNIEEINNKSDDKKTELNNLLISKNDLQSEIKILNEKINSIKISNNHYNERNDYITLDIEKLVNEKEKLVIDRDLILEEIKKYTEILKTNDSIYMEILNKKNDINLVIDENKSEIIRLLNEKSNISSRVERYETMLENINIRKAELNQKMLRFQSEKDSQASIIEKFISELDEVSSELELLKNQENDFLNKNQEISISIKRNKEKIEENQILFHKNNSNLEALKNMTERYEGYGNTIKKIMELKDEKQGIIGVVADIIKVEKKYETAIETALGGSIQNIVTDTENTAKEVIEYLKKNKFGRATFLPLSSILNKTGFTNEAALNEKGVIGLASDLVEIKKEWSNISRYLLGRVIVVDNIDNALLLSRKYNNTLRIVTLEGENISPGGSISGGAFKNSSNLLGRRREIEELENNLKGLKIESDTLLKSLEELKKDDETYKIKLEEIRMLLNEKTLIHNTLLHNLNTAKGKREELDKNYVDFDRESLEIKDQINDISNNKKTLLEELNHWEEKNVLIEKNIVSLNEELKALIEDETRELKQTEEKKLELTSLQQKLVFQKENINRVESDIIKFTNELKELEGLFENSHDEIEKIENSVKEMENAILNTEKLIKEAEEELNVLSNEKERFSKEHKEFFDKREEISSNIANLDKEIFRISAAKEKLDEKYDLQVNYMWDEYEITYSQATSSFDLIEEDILTLRKEINNLKSGIKNLGSVNVNAIEEFKEVMDRYTFLKTQHDDLVTAEETLLKIIEELDIGMRLQFNEKFYEIKAEFDKVFKILFGGGKGSIELDDESDILEAGISIISQPPGKKLQNMMQLSGGEKALTAIALLFAIQNLKPSPFCLLDEIEAALDDSNVVRYAKYLHKLTDHTQFIVITHRRGTMASADRLYGITMQEKGVSTLVSVDLLEDQLEETKKD